MEETLSFDARGIPTSECPSCASNIFTIQACFDPETYEIEMYLLNAECAMCGTLVTAPTPLDLPGVCNE
jgi:hypothetical protein